MNDNSPPDETQGLVFNFEQGMREHSSMAINVGTHFIGTTEDKVELILLKHISNVENRSMWKIPLGILIPLVSIPLTANFKSFWFLSASQVATICYMLIIGVAIWLIVALIIRYRTRKTTISTIISEIKTSQTQS